LHSQLLHCDARRNLKFTNTTSRGLCPVDHDAADSLGRCDPAITGLLPLARAHTCTGWVSCPSDSLACTCSAFLSGRPQCSVPCMEATSPEFVRASPRLTPVASAASISAPSTLVLDGETLTAENLMRYVNAFVCSRRLQPWLAAGIDRPCRVPPEFNSLRFSPVRGARVDVVHRRGVIARQRDGRRLQVAVLCYLCAVRRRVGAHREGPRGNHARNREWEGAQVFRVGGFGHASQPPSPIAPPLEPALPRLVLACAAM
jgi:hypothetical protein